MRTRSLYCLLRHARIMLLLLSLRVTITARGIILLSIIFWRSMLISALTILIMLLRVLVIVYRRLTVILLYLQQEISLAEEPPCSGVGRCLHP